MSLGSSVFCVLEPAAEHLGAWRAKSLVPDDRLNFVSSILIFVGSLRHQKQLGLPQFRFLENWRYQNIQCDLAALRDANAA